MHLGEEDWVHTSEPVMVVRGLMARLCLSVDPETEADDSRYVLIGDSELT